MKRGTLGFRAVFTVWILVMLIACGHGTQVLLEVWW